MKARFLQLAGLLVTALAFFLPAVRSPESAQGSGSYTGFLCAYVAGAATFAMIRHGFSGAGFDAMGTICLVLSGWVNPLAVVYLLFTLGSRYLNVRRILAVSLLICLIATWIFLAKAPMVPLVGHYLWVAGLLLIISPEVAAVFKPDRLETN